MDNRRLHPSGSPLDNLVKGPVCLTSCQWDLGQCALEFRTSREEENTESFFLPGFVEVFLRQLFYVLSHNRAILHPEPE